MSMGRSWFILAFLPEKQKVFSGKRRVFLFSEKKLVAETQCPQSYKTKEEQEGINCWTPVLLSFVLPKLYMLLQDLSLINFWRQDLPALMLFFFPSGPTTVHEFIFIPFCLSCFRATFSSPPCMTVRVSACLMLSSLPASSVWQLFKQGNGRVREVLSLKTSALVL